MVEGLLAMRGFFFFEPSRQLKRLYLTEREIERLMARFC
jgi:hypothetical protein